MIDADLRQALERDLGDDISFDTPMSRFTSMRVGGPVDAMATPRDRKALSRVLTLAAEHDVPVTPIGEGFNLFVLDAGLDGIAIKLSALRHLERTADDELLAEAGVRHARITRFCIDASLSGLEFAAGIPGSVGGWLSMNAGIGTREMVDVTVAIEFMSQDGRTTNWVDASELSFAYRHLAGLPDGAIITAARFRVEAVEPGTVKRLVDEHMAHRARTQPLNVPSCGSVFRNPSGDYAGRLIEAAGLKGLRIGGAEVTQIHANFIATDADATAADVRELITQIQQRVEADSGVHLETEVKILGRAKP